MKRTLLIFAGLLILFSSCKKEEEKVYPPTVVLINGDGITENDAVIPVGGKLRFSIAASSKNAPITNFRVQRIVNGRTITELDKGIYITEGGFSYTYNAVKSGAEIELWRFMIMNANRDSATITRTVLLGEGSAYGAINHYPSLFIGMQNNSLYPQFVDLHSGNLFTNATVSGNESTIDLVGFVYQTSGVMSPTLCCPAYTGSSSVTTHYPIISNWAIRNATQYDYNSSDYNLVNPTKFELAQNDSLLVESFNPQSVSGLSKFAYTGKIVPFKTDDGKYGLIRVKHSDITADGYMELEIKIQQ
jgi:hypothetical protein